MSTTSVSRLWWLVLAVVLLVHLVTLYVPGSPDGQPGLFPHTDKVVHIVAFGVPAGLLRLVVRRWWPIVLLALHAPVSELIQHAMIPNRGGEVLDVVADLLGVGLGILTAHLLPAGHRPRVVAPEFR